MINGEGYSMNVYCDGTRTADEAHNDAGTSTSCAGSKEMGEGFGETRHEAKRSLERRGWMFRKDGRTLCPTCANRRRELIA